jgi:hypothetical protein
LTAATALALVLVLAAALNAARSNGAKGDGTLKTGRAIVMVSDPDAVGDGGAADPSTPAGEARARHRIASVVNRNDLTTVRSLPELGAVAVDPPAGLSLAALLDRLSGQPGVVSAQPEYARKLRYVPNDPGYDDYDSHSPFGRRQWNLTAERFQTAWRWSRGPGRIAVIDTGVASHPDLNSRVVSAVNTSGDGTSARSDTYGHGTHVAGLACATGNNGYGISGADPRCHLRVEKASSGDSLDDSAIADAIRDATNRGVDVINMSFGGGGADSLLNSAISYAWGRGVVMVAAADNFHTQDQGYPAAYLQPPGTGSNIYSGRGLVVTGAYYNGVNADTGYGSGISLAAYGFSRSSGPGVFSTFPANCTDLEAFSIFGGCQKASPPRSVYRGDERFGYLQGTSMAAPQVAGAAGLMRALRPSLSARKILTALKRYATGNYSSELGWGILNAGEALRWEHRKYG